MRVMKAGMRGMRIKANGDPGEIRTPDTLIKSQLLCQLSYRTMGHILDDLPHIATLAHDFFQRILRKASL
jgi:hypothetical protein